MLSTDSALSIAAIAVRSALMARLLRAFIATLRSARIVARSACGS
ncbi:Uncharacterised protein [Mycobacteroides abscessus subsp. abscessus]|nr:Uncharacterised protein [Mycobacteroides abscessus subsp. abscessus]